jgi:hypothetical protein
MQEMKITRKQLRQMILEATATHDDYGREKFTYADPGGMDYQVSAFGDTALRKMSRNMEGAGWSAEQIERFSRLRYNNFLDASARHVDHWFLVAMRQDWSADQILYFFDNHGKYLPTGITKEMFEAWRAAT